MKKSLYILLGLILFSCNNDDSVASDSQINNNDTNKIALLKIDFLTNTFEGGKQLDFPTSESNFTISSAYQEPGDFGDVQLYYQEFDDMIFDGTIHWMGLGERSYPENINEADTFALNNETLAFPNETMFELVMYDELAYYPEQVQYENIWNAINNLEIVASYRNLNPEGTIHLFLYTPSVGIGNPADWDWYVFMKN